MQQLANVLWVFAVCDRRTDLSFVAAVRTQLLQILSRSTSSNGDASRGGGSKRGRSKDSRKARSAGSSSAEDGGVGGVGDGSGGRDDPGGRRDLSGLRDEHLRQLSQFHVWTALELAESDDAAERAEAQALSLPV